MLQPSRLFQPRGQKETHATAATRGLGWKGTPGLARSAENWSLWVVPSFRQRANESNDVTPSHVSDQFCRPSRFRSTARGEWPCGGGGWVEIPLSLHTIHRCLRKTTRAENKHGPGVKPRWSDTLPSNTILTQSDPTLPKSFAFLSSGVLRRVLHASVPSQSSPDRSLAGEDIINKGSGSACHHPSQPTTYPFVDGT